MDVNQRKKNLLIIIHHLCRGGAERSAAKLSELLHEHFNIYIVTFIDERFYETSFSYKGKLTNIGQAPAKSKIQKVKNIVERVRFLRNFKAEHHIDISLSYLATADFANVLSRQGEKVFITLRSFLSKSLSGRMQANMVKILYPKADGIITQNLRALKDAADNFGIAPSKLKVIPNFYDFEGIKTLYEADTTPEWKTTGTYFKLFQVGRLYHPKGQWYLLRIFKRVVESVPKARLILAGTGDMEDFLVDYAHALGLRVQNLNKETHKIPDFERYNVIFLGFTKNPFKYLRHSDLFLFTSIYEGFPNALAEAMICGSMVFSTDCKTGPKELIAPDRSTPIDEYPLQSPYGVLFPAFDGEVIAAETPILKKEKLWIEAIIKYAQNPDALDQIKTNAKKRMREFDQAEVKKLWIKLFDNA